MNGDNPVTTSKTLSRCAYQAGKTNVFFNFGNLRYITFDNLEITGMCSADASLNGYDMVFEYGFSPNIIFQNIYFHGWSHVQFNCSAGGSCFDIFLFRGGATSPPACTYRYIVVDGSDSDPAGAGVFYADGWNVAYSYFGNAAQIIVRLPHVWHDNLIEYWYDPGDKSAHGNVLESVGDAAGTNAFYNNVIRHVSPNGVGQVVIWLLPPAGSTDYLFNNVLYDINNAGNYYDIGENFSRHAGKQIIFNNTFEQNKSGPVLCCTTGTTLTRPFTAANNHYITDFSSPYVLPNCKTASTLVTELAMTHAKAAKQGYTASETYAYSPTRASKSTVGAGTNEQTNFCAALSTAAGSDSTLSDAATACQSDTRYACTYNRNNHTVTCPARTVVARPSSGAWDAGAYEYSSSGNQRAVYQEVPKYR
jgi:hypothetical protein